MEILNIITTIHLLITPIPKRQTLLEVCKARNHSRLSMSMMSRLPKIGRFDRSFLAVIFFAGGIGYGQNPLADC